VTEAQKSVLAFKQAVSAILTAQTPPSRQKAERIVAALCGMIPPEVYLAAEADREMIKATRESFLVDPEFHNRPYHAYHETYVRFVQSIIDGERP